MPDERSRSAEPNAPAKPTDAIPRALRAAGGHLVALEFLLDFGLGLISIALGTWYVLSRPGIAVLAVAVLLAGVVVLHVWRHLTEHPRRDSGYRRRQEGRTES